MAFNYLRELDAACVLLGTSKKVGERKNALERVLQLSNMDVVRKSLHSKTRAALESASSARDDSITWGHVFDAVCQMVMLELHHTKTKYENSLKKGGIPKSGSLVRADVEVALRRVLEIADEDGPINFRSIGTMLDHVHRVLSYLEVIAVQFLPEYCKLLCENILGVTSYCFMLFPSKCKKLLRIFFDLYRLSAVALAPVLPSLLARTVLSVLRAFPYEFTVIYPMTHEFVCGAFRVDSASKADVNLLRVMNFTVLQVAASMPQGVRDLGERFSSVFIRQWQTSRDHLLKYEVAMFFRIQLTLNVYYTGVPSPTDWLEDLFDVIQNDDNWSTGDVFVSVVDLMANLAYHLSTQATRTREDPVVKKRRTHCVWDEILRPLRSAVHGHISQRALRAIMVLERIVEGFPSIVTPTAYEELVSALAKVIDHSDGIREDGPLKLLCHLAALRCVRPGESDSALAELWRDVWSSVVKVLPSAGVPSNDRQMGRTEHCLALLADILRHGRLDTQFVRRSQAALWESLCFTDTSCRSSAAVDLLVVFLSHYELDDAAASKVPRREKLLGWLLSPGIVDERTPASAFPPLARKLSIAVDGLVQPGPPLCLSSAVIESWQNPLQLERQVESTSTKDDTAHFLASERALRAIILGRDLYSTAAESTVNEVQRCYSRNYVPLSLRIHLLRITIQLLKDRNVKAVANAKNVAAHHRRTLGVDLRGVSRSVVESAMHMSLIVRLLRAIEPVTSVVCVDVRGSMLLLFEEMMGIAVSGMQELCSNAGSLIPCIQSLQELFPLCSARGEDPAMRHFDASVAHSLHIAMEPLVNFLLEELSKLLRLSTVASSDASDDIRKGADDFGMEDMDVVERDGFDGGGNSSRLAISCIYELITAIGSLAHLGAVASDSAQFCKVGQIFVSMLDADVPASCKFEILQWLHCISATIYDTKAAEYIGEFLRKKTELSGDGVVRRNILRLLSAVGPALIRRCINHDEARSYAINECKESLRYFLKLCQRKGGSTPRLNWKTRLCFAKCLRDFIVCDDEESEYLDVFAGLLADSNFYVRTYMSQVIVLLFELWSDHEAIFADIYQEHLAPLLFSDPTDDEDRFSAEAKEVTALITLGEIACVSRPNESSILFQLLATSVGRDPQILSLVSYIIEHMASALGYPSSQALVADHMGDIMQRWAKDIPILDFPVRICGFSSIEEFYAHYASQLLPRIVLLQRHDLLKLVSTTIGLDAKQLIESHYASIFACTFPLLYCEEPTDKDILTRFVGHYIGLRRVDELTPERFDDILLCMLGSMSYDEHVTIPFFKPKCVRAVVDHLVNSFNLRSVSELLLKKSDRVANLIMRLNEMVANAPRAHQKVRHFRAILFLLELLGANACRFAIIRDVIYSGLRFISDTALLPWVCLLLLHAVRVSLQHKPSVLVSKGHDHVGVMIPSLERFASAASSESLSTISDILNALFASSDPNVRAAVLRLDPLSDLAIFENFNRMLQGATGDQSSMLDRIHSFIIKMESGQDSITSRLPHIMRQREAALRSMDSVLSREISKIIDLLREASVVSNTAGVTPEIKCIEDLIRTLVQCCHPEHGENIRMLAGKCLGHLGTVDPDVVSVFAFSHNGTEQSNEDVLGSAKERAIRLLSEYLNDPDVNTAKIAAASLRGILATPSGIAACNSKTFPSVTRRSLSPYINADPRVDELCFDHIADAHVLTDEVWSTAGKSYGDWISKLTYALGVSAVSDEVLRNCSIMCLVKFEVAEILFPHFVLDVVLQDTESRYGLVSMMSVTLAKRMQLLLADSKSCTDALKLFLSTLDFLRTRIVALQRKEPRSAGPKRKKRSISLHSSHVRFWDNIFWREIALLDIAEVAVKCQAFVTALAYVEYWCEKEWGDLILPGDVADIAKSRTSLPSSESLSKANCLLLDIFSNVDDPDCLYALQHLKSSASILKRYEHEENWLSAVGTYDMLLLGDCTHAETVDSRTSPVRLDLHRGLLSALNQLGFSSLPNLYLRGFAARYPSHFAGLSEYQYESAWRTRQWDLGWVASHHIQLDPEPVPENWPFCAEEASTRPRVTGFHHGAYQVLKALEDGDSSGFRVALEATRYGLVHEIGSSSFETSKRVYPALARLQILEEVEDIWKIRWGFPQSNGSMVRVPGDDELAGTFRTWQSHHQWLKRQFALIEPILAAEMTLLNMLDSGSETLKRLVSELLLTQSKLARRAGRNHLALTALNKLSHFRIPEVELLSEYHSARVFWNQGEKDRAIHAVKNIIKRVSANELPVDDPKLYAKVILYAGKWIAARGAERSDAIKRDYLEKAIREHVKYDGANAGKAFLTLARFSDAQHTDLSTRRSSREFKASQKLRQRAEKELRQVETLERSSKVSLEMRRHKIVLKTQVDIDKQEQARMESEIASTLESAMKNYLECLCRDDEHDIRVPFRLCSLWFTNADTEEVNRLIDSKLKALQMWKFLPLIYQIVSRLSSAKTAFQRVLKAFIYRMVVKYPHHCLWQILALKNSGVSQSRKPIPDAYLDRAKAADKLLRRCRMLIPLEKLVYEMEHLSNAYISLAMQPISDKIKSRPGPHKIANRIIEIRSLNNVVVPTVCLPPRAIDLTRDHDNMEFPHVVGFHPQFTLHGGINLPKAIYCLGSDGKRYKQLVKGNDDLRQDAVMQQIFNVVNRLLSRDSETRRRRLTVRSYKIIPLSPHAGLVEWVGNSMPLSEYLIGKNRDPEEAAHVRFRPSDLPHRECRKKLEAASQARKLETYLEITEQFKPVFHHFFLEKFSEPSEWFAKRLAYTRSVASNSIVGHIVGLGDRHSTNILIDIQSAELVHIDLGVAFEQGMTLRHPELVPFRLTRDIVDGMGVMGVEGVFRHCCEKTLKVLRENHQLIITILEVFMHDPLYKWTLSPLKALRLQHQTLPNDPLVAADSPTSISTTSEAAGNKHTERTLLRVKAKLLGYDSEERLSIEGQVQRLITEARDPLRLSKMFVGWAPWL